MNEIIESLNGIYGIECTKNDQYHNQTSFVGIKGSPIYGEITYKGVEGLVNRFNKYFNKDTIFYDLGSGLGKLIMHIALKYPIKKACGIEYSVERYQGAIDSQQLYCSHLTNIKFINDSILNVNISDATVIYFDNTTMPPEGNEQILSIIPMGCLVISRQEFHNHPSIYIKGKESQFVTTYNGKHLYYFIKE